MKQILIYLLLSLTSVAVSAQEYQYVPFPDSNAVWSEVYWKPISEPCPRWVYNKYALFNEDTVINDIKYHKLFHTNASEITKENSTCIGGIREDSLKRIWFKQNEVIGGYNDVFLFYDFSLNVGDTVKTTILKPSLHYSFIVTSIDTIELYDVKRKVFSIDQDEVVWIEGIGNVEGILIQNPAWPTNGEGNDLICFHQNDSLLFFNEDFDDCVPSFVLNDVSILPNPEVKVYPNPATGESVYFEGLDFEKLELYDNTGNLFFSENISGVDKYVLDVSAITPGVYFYQLKKPGLLPTGGKLIIP